MTKDVKLSDYLHSIIKFLKYVRKTNSNRINFKIANSFGFLLLENVFFYQIVNLKIDRHQG